MAVRAVASCGDGCGEQQSFGLLVLSAVWPWGYCRRGKRQPSGASKAGYNLAQGHAAHNVRAKWATTGWRQARDAENVQRTRSPGLVACRWRSA
jgi:hypothetical protein